MENQKGSSDGEDIPSDFFDDFSKEEFIEGLSVVDSWDDTDKKLRTKRPRINAEDVNKVDDLRDLIVGDKQDEIILKDRFHWRRVDAQSHSTSTTEQRRSGSISRMDSYIKPGSRRDPSKTNQAIKKDKEEKVKEYLAKHLESSDEIRPPGTELDDFFEAKKAESKKQPAEAKVVIVPKQRATKTRRESPMKRREVARDPPPRRHWSPRRPQAAAHSPRRSPRRSPQQRTLRRFSPRRASPRRFSPNRNFRRNQHNSPRRSSPELRRRLKSRSPIKHSYRRSRSHSRSPNFRDRESRRRSRSRSRNRKPDVDDFLYPKDYYPPEFVTVQPEIPYPGPPIPPYTEPMIVEYPGGVPPGYPYPQGAPYGGYAPPYEYQVPPAAPMVMPAPPMVMPAPQPVPAPILPPVIPAPDMTPGLPPPTMVPAPQPMIPSQALTPRMPEHVNTSPADALAKLVADGILSHEDYLKLAPNKGVSHVMDTPARVEVLHRINNALSKLGTLTVPARCIVNNNMITAGSEQKEVPPKFCSPLKRQTTMEFNFTKSDAATVRKRNKEIVELITCALQLENVVGKTKKRQQKNTNDAETQTTKPFCDVCEIRESTKLNDIGTSIDREQIFSTAHTQVVEQDLFSSKAVFNPSGSIADGAPISIAHMTPAQLVSQLAARAKTLKQTDPPASNQYRNPHNSYDYDGRGGGGQYHGNDYNNYRY